MIVNGRRSSSELVAQHSYLRECIDRQRAEQMGRILVRNRQRILPPRAATGAQEAGTLSITLHER